MAGAITSQTWIPNALGDPADLGHVGKELVRVVLDGAGAVAAVAVTLPANASIKHITGVSGGVLKVNAGTTFPVLGTTGVSVTCTATNNAVASEIVDVIFYGTGF